MLAVSLCASTHDVLCRHRVAAVLAGRGYVTPYDVALTALATLPHKIALSLDNGALRVYTASLGCGTLLHNKVALDSRAARACRRGEGCADSIAVTDEVANCKAGVAGSHFIVLEMSHIVY